MCYVCHVCMCASHVLCVHVCVCHPMCTPPPRYALAFFRNTPPLRPEAPVPWDPAFSESVLGLVKVDGRWYIPGDGPYDVPPELAGCPIQAPLSGPAPRPKQD